MTIEGSEPVSYIVGLNDIIPGRINRIRAYFKLSVLQFGNMVNLLKETAQSGVPDEDTQNLREEIRTLETCRRFGAWAIEKEMVAPEYRDQVSDILGFILMSNQEADF